MLFWFKGIQQRIVLATLTFWVFVNYVLMANCFSLALPQMVVANVDQLIAVNNSTEACAITRQIVNHSVAENTVEVG